MQYVASLLKWSVRIAATVGVLYTAAIGLIAVFQDKMVYVPRVPGMATEFVYTPANYHLAHEDVYLTAADGVRIHAWMIWPSDWDAKRRATRPVVLFFQENAGNMQYRLYFIRDMVHYLQCSVLAVRLLHTTSAYTTRAYATSAPVHGCAAHTHTPRPLVTGAMGQARASRQRQGSSWTQQPRSSTWPRATTATRGGWSCMGGRWVGRSRLRLLRRSHTRCVCRVSATTAMTPTHPTSQVKALIIENTFTSLVDLVPVVLPILRPVIGPGRCAKSWALCCHRCGPAGRLIF